MQTASPATPYGKLVVCNVVTTYWTTVGDAGPVINLPAIALSARGKYGRAFPAVVCKALIPIKNVPVIPPSPALLYPIKSKVKIPKSQDSKMQNHARNKQFKAKLHIERQLAPKLFMSATNLQFKTGKNVVAGGTSIAANQLIAELFVRRLSFDLGITLRIYNFTVQNIVCSTDIGFRLNPDWIVRDADEKGFDVNFEPSEFTGLSWVTTEDDLSIVFVVFDSGKIVATGMDTMDQIEIAEERIQRLIAPYRAGNEPAGFDSAPLRLRDSETLGAIKSNILSSSSHGARPTKVNASKRNKKKLTQGMRDMMKRFEKFLDFNEDPGDSLLNGEEEDQLPDTFLQECEENEDGKMKVFSVESE